MRSPSGTTRLAGIIGDPVRHSLSPAMHNAAFEALDLDWVYVAFPVVSANAGTVIDAARTLGIEGLSVTMPHKAQVAAAVDELSADARTLGAVNTVVRRGDRFIGETTDGPGFVDALAGEGIDVAGVRCAVVGAGGAGRAVVLALSRAGARAITVVNRDAGRGRAAVALAPTVARLGGVEEIADAELIVNATPVGMGADSRLAFPVERLGPGHIVNDLIYHPEMTPVLAAAAERGCRTVGGLGMLLHQAGRQFRMWTGEAPPLGAMRAAVRGILAAR